MRAWPSAASSASPRPLRVASAREPSRGRQPLVGFRGSAVCVGADPPPREQWLPRSTLACGRRGRRRSDLNIVGIVSGGLVETFISTLGAPRPMGPLDPTPWPWHAGQWPWLRSLSAQRSRAFSAPTAGSASPRARPCSRPAVLSCGTSYALRTGQC